LPEILLDETIFELCVRVISSSALALLASLFALGFSLGLALPAIFGLSHDRTLFEKWLFIGCHTHHSTIPGCMQ
jgi:hypothetical protein